MIAKRVLRKGPDKALENILKEKLEPSRFKSLNECILYYRNNFKLNELKIMKIGNSVIVSNYYNNSFAWLCEFIDITEEEFNEQVFNEG